MSEKATFRHTANDEFKRTSSITWPLGLLAAVVLHFGFLQAFPRLAVTAPAAPGGVLEAVEMPPEVRVPPPPEQIARPATPRVASVELDEDVTIAPTTFEQNPAESLGPPPSAVRGDEERPEFIPYDVAPKLKNRAEVLALLQKTYPRLLRDAGVGGTVQLWLFVDERGQVAETRVAESSGYDSLDDAARQVAASMEFTPAMNRDKVTPVWISQPIDFSIIG